jgi:hypothetical protein
MMPAEQAAEMALSSNLGGASIRKQSDSNAIYCQKAMLGMANLFHSTKT